MLLDNYVLLVGAEVASCAVAGSMPGSPYMCRKKRFPQMLLAVKTKKRSPRDEFLAGKQKRERGAERFRYLGRVTTDIPARSSARASVRGVLPYDHSPTLSCVFV